MGGVCRRRRGAVRGAAALVALVAMGAACGEESSPADEALAATAERLADIESANIFLSMLASTEGGPSMGFELSGATTFPDTGLPVANLRYRQTAGAAAVSSAFVSTGEEAFVTTGDRVCSVPLEWLGGGEGSALPATTASGAAPAAPTLATLRIDDWFEKPRLTRGGDVGGVATDRVAARLDPVAAANDLLDLAGTSGVGGFERLTGDDAEQFRRAVRSGTVEIYTGREDRMLRRLAITMDLAPGLDVPEDLRRLVGARFTMQLELSDLNRELDVTPPEGASAPCAEA